MPFVCISTCSPFSDAEHSTPFPIPTLCFQRTPSLLPLLSSPRSLSGAPTPARVPSPFPLSLGPLRCSACLPPRPLLLYCYCATPATLPVPSAAPAARPLTGICQHPSHRLAQRDSRRIRAVLGEGESGGEQGGSKGAARGEAAAWHAGPSELWKRWERKDSLGTRSSVFFPLASNPTPPRTSQSSAPTGCTKRTASSTHHTFQPTQIRSLGSSARSHSARPIRSVAPFALERRFAYVSPLPYPLASSLPSLQLLAPSSTSASVPLSFSLRLAIFSF